MRVSSEVETPRVFGGGGEEWGLVGSAKEEVTGRVGQVGLDQEVPPRSQLCPNLPAQWSEMGELSLSVKAWACFFSPQPAVLSLLLSVANCQPSLGAWPLPQAQLCTPRFSRPGGLHQPALAPVTRPPRALHHGQL